MKDLYKSSIVVFLILFSWSYSQGQPNPKHFPDSLSLDGSIRYGVLKNGITYYIKPLDEPHPELQMTLMVKTGSFEEESHEMDFAHHIEHLAFRETKNFPEGLKSNSSLLTSLNMHSRNLFGRTGANVTQYYFNAPSKNLEAVSTGLMWFLDIATGINLSEVNINRERGVLLQEHRAGEANEERFSAESELFHRLFPCLNNLEGFTDHNKSFPYQDLQRFYRKWYRPARMAIGILGNIEDVDKLEQMIIKKYEGVNSVLKPLVERNCGKIYFQSQPSFEVVKSNSQSINGLVGNPISINLYYRDPEAFGGYPNWDQIKRKFKGEIIAVILNERLKASSIKYGNRSSFSSLHTVISSVNSANLSSGKPPSALKIVIQSPLNGEEDDLQNAIYIIKQLRTYGITREELEVFKKKIQNNWNVTNIKDPKYWIDQIKFHFVLNEPLPAHKYAELKKWVTNLSINEINETIERVITKMPDDIGIIIPESYGDTILHSEENTRKLITESFEMPVSIYKSPPVITEVMSEKKMNLLKAQEVVKVEKSVKDSRKYKLSNGINLILKPKSSKKETPKIYLHGYSPYGASCFPKDEYYSAMFAPFIIRNSGVGNLTKFDLKSFYKNTGSLKPGVIPYIHYNESGIKTEVEPEELEYLLQLVYLFFAKPRHDKLAFEDWKTISLQHAPYTINTVNDLIDALNDVTKDYSRLPYASKKINAIQKVKFEKAYKIYKLLFGNPENFTFILVGDFNETETLSLLQKYLGNLPTTSKVECVVECQKPILPQGPILHKVNTSEFYRTDNSYYGLQFVRDRKQNEDWKEKIKVEILGTVTNRLIFALRADDGLSLYHFAAGANYNYIMDRYEIGFRFNCTPEELSVIRIKTREIIKDIKQGKLSKETFIHGKNMVLPRYNQHTFQQLSKIGEEIYNYYRYDKPLPNPIEVESYINSLTVEDIIETSRKYFKDEYLYELIMQEAIVKN